MYKYSPKTTLSPALSAGLRFLGLLQPVPVEWCLDLTVSPIASLSVPGIPGSQWPWQWLGLPVVQGCAAQLRLSCGDPKASAFSPLASSPAAAPPGELTRMTGRKVQVHTSHATAWLFFLIQLGSYFLVLVCLPRAFFFFLPFFPFSLSLFLSLFPHSLSFIFWSWLQTSEKEVLPNDAFLFSNDQSASATSQENQLPRKLLRHFLWVTFFILQGPQPFLKQIFIFFLGSDVEISLNSSI